MKGVSAGFEIVDAPDEDESEGLEIVEEAESFNTLGKEEVPVFMNIG
jgi:hypothetical protein